MMKILKFERFKKWMSSNVRLSACLLFELVIMLGVILVYYFLPIFLNYGPGTINTKFDLEVSGGLSYFMQYFIIFLALSFLGLLFIIIQTRDFKDLEKIKYELHHENNEVTIKKVNRIVKKCMTLPQSLFLFISLAPTIALSLIFLILGFTSFADVKVILVITTISILASSVAYIFFKSIFKSTLTYLGNTKKLKQTTFSLTGTSILQLSSLLLVSVIYTFLLLYSNNMQEKSSILKEHYTLEVKSMIENAKPRNIEDLKEILAEMSFIETNDIVFLLDTENNIHYSNDIIITNSFLKSIKDFVANGNKLSKFSNNEFKGVIIPTKIDNQNFLICMEEDAITTTKNDLITNVTASLKTTNPKNINQLKEILPNSFFLIDDTNNIYFANNIAISDFFLKYAKELSTKYDNIVYDYYGTETQGVVIPAQINDDVIKIVVKYDLTNHLLSTTFSNMFIILIYCGISLYFFSGSITREISTISQSMQNMAGNKKGSLNEKLPVTSNDEIGDLIVAFNNLQDLTTQYINQIESSQQTLLEQERLASLGQMIGGIAHNMKTPIMSVSGAAEGLTELVGEYIASIDNPSVNSDDHREIAKDMLDWITKIKTHTAYMSDIITAVKGQASQLATTDYSTFSVYDLIKKVDILVKHEIKKALLTLETKIECEPTLALRGDINNLIQVIINLISNSIQAYNGKPNEKILLTVSADDSNVFIKIIDNGSGMSDEIKNKLFKEMVTTKGKNGTGLGLYMSYSTIKGKFNGNIEFNSELNVGTTFIITLPLHKEEK